MVSNVDFSNQRQYQKPFINHNNLNCDRIFHAKHQLSLILLNRTAMLPDSAE